MSKIWIIFKREYLTRVKKKSFLILTILTPLLFAGIVFVPGYLATRESKEEHKVAVCDRSSIFLGELNDSKSTSFHFVPQDEFDDIKENLKTNEYYALLDIPQNILTTKRVIVYSHKQVTLDVKNHIDRQIERLLEDKQRAELIERVGIPDLEEQLQATKTNISVETIKMGDDGVGKKGSTEIAMGVGYAAGFLIYMFVFIYGSMVMRGVTEEKQNRIVEVIISSAKPVQLMMGKIIGLAAVGLTQFLIWVLLAGGILFGAQSFVSTEDSMLQTLENQSVMMADNPMAAQVMDKMEADSIEQLIEEILEIIQSIDFTQIIVFFLIYFLLGYLLYSSLMAAVASAVDSEEDMNQFMLPITVPLIGSIIILASVIKNPEGPLAFWASHIPFTSPIIMMVRIPFGVPWYEILISISILAASTFGVIWMAAKIYRTGILMYGKKPSWKELGKWLSYRN